MNMATHTTLTDEQSTEVAIQKAGKTAPRITPAHIDSLIIDRLFFTAYEASIGQEVSPQERPLIAMQAHGLLTFCVLTLRNGFTVTGESACASPENFDAGIGRDIAFKNAREKVWLLEGYLLKERLFQMTQPAESPAPSGAFAPHQQRVLDERTELDAKLSKLNGFFGTSIYTCLPEEERERLAAQARVMGEYSSILGDRIAAFE